MTKFVLLTVTLLVTLLFIQVTLAENDLNQIGKDIIDFKDGPVGQIVKSALQWGHGGYPHGHHHGHHDHHHGGHHHDHHHGGHHHDHHGGHHDHHHHHHHHHHDYDRRRW